ncbi:MAG: protein translocase subunit SecF, partial [Gammaproteobacteria bacterium]|nr:protein translocase subunit SecF [Gammaproteobacteria bacterium]
MSKRKVAVVFSALLLSVSIVSLVTQKLNFGIDFTGGTLVEVSYGETVELDEVRSVLSATEFRDAVVQYFGSAS